MKKRKTFWGFVLVLLAVCLIVGQYDGFQGVGTWKIILSILGGAVALDGLVDLSIERFVAGLAILCVLWKNQIGLHQLNGWTILLAALLLIAGLKIIFRPFKMKAEAWKMRRTMKRYDREIASGNKKAEPPQGAPCGPNMEENEALNGSHVRVKRNFAGGAVYVRSSDFQRADIDLCFSGLKMYFDDATIRGEDATLHINVAFSGLELYIPSEWAIDDRLECFAGGVKIMPRPQNIAATKTLKLKGSAAFGGVTVYYI